MRQQKNLVQEPGVIVLGGHIQALGIVRTFGSLQIPSVVMDSKKINLAKFSKYCIKSYVVGYDAILELLLSLASAGKYQGWLVFPTDDFHVRMLSENKDELSRHYKVMADSWKVVELFYKKYLSYPLAESCGVPIPQTIYPKAENGEELASVLKYPCIIKPSVMREFYMVFRKKVLYCADAEQFMVNFSMATEHFSPSELMVQEVIPGSSENQYSVGLLVWEGKIVNHLVARRRRQHPLDFGNATTYAETIMENVLLDYATRIVQKAMYNGICEVEFKYDHRTGEFKFLEVNPRLWKWHLLAEFACVHILKNAYAIAMGNPVKPNVEYKECAWKDVYTDLHAVMMMKVKGIYTKPVSKPIVPAVFSFSDPMPFIIQTIFLGYLLITRR
jgi:predicted ATP-grasp superfamily ATP-dependent carboligase